MVYRFYENGVGHVRSEILGSCKMNCFQGFSPYAELRMKLFRRLAITPSLAPNHSAPFSAILECISPSEVLFWSVKPEINNRQLLNNSYQQRQIKNMCFKGNVASYVSG